MSLKDEATRAKKGPRNNIRVFMAEHPDLVEELFDAMNDLTVPSAGIVRALRGRGIDLPGRTSIEKYRRDEYVDLPFPSDPEDL